MHKVVLAATAVALSSSGAYGQGATSGTHSCEGLAQLEMTGAVPAETKT